MAAYRRLHDCSRFGPRCVVGKVAAEVDGGKVRVRFDWRSEVLLLVMLRWRQLWRFCIECCFLRGSFGGESLEVWESCASHCLKDVCIYGVEGWHMGCHNIR